MTAGVYGGKILAICKSPAGASSYPLALTCDKLPVLAAYGKTHGEGAPVNDKADCISVFFCHFVIWVNA